MPPALQLSCCNFLAIRAQIGSLNLTNERSQISLTIECPMM